ncbi:MAG TPA: TolC family protein [Woeseiaceae bacterium]|nr:TolC family protein [Woeseiaceae bacterium]
MRPTPIQEALLFAAWLAVAPFAAAGNEDANGNPGRPLTAEALVAWVLETNAGLAAAEAAAEAAAYGVEPAGSLDDPMLSYRAARSAEQNIDISQRIPWPGTLGARESVARHAASAADWAVASERLALTAAAKSAYAEWYFAARGLEIRHQVQSLLDDLVATAETRYAAGRALRQDVLQAEVERAELDAEELELLRAQTAARARINGLLNRPPETPLPPAAGIAVRRPVLDARALERLTVDRHPELKQLDAEIAAANSRITVARKAFYPDFQIHAGYNALWNNPDKRPMLGVSINIPFDRGKRHAELDMAQAGMRRAESMLADRRSGLLAKVAGARAELDESVGTIELYENELLPLADDYLHAAVADYRSGAGAFLNVVTAEQNLLTTELDLERTRADYLRRFAELELLTGGRLEAAGKGENQ